MDTVRDNVKKQLNKASKEDQVYADRLRKQLDQNDMTPILTDFEDYMLRARRGGTTGKLRDPKESQDEDIRAGLVQ